MLEEVDNLKDLAVISNPRLSRNSNVDHTVFKAVIKS